MRHPVRPVSLLHLEAAMSQSKRLPGLLFIPLSSLVFQVCEERHRFETLMDYFKNYDEFHIDFMVNVDFLFM